MEQERKQRQEKAKKYLKLTKKRIHDEKILKQQEERKRIEEKQQRLKALEEESRRLAHAPLPQPARAMAWGNKDTVFLPAASYGSDGVRGEGNRSHGRSRSRSRSKERTRATQDNNVTSPVLNSATVDPMSVIDPLGDRIPSHNVLSEDNRELQWWRMDGSRGRKSPQSNQSGLKDVTSDERGEALLSDTVQSSQGAPWNHSVPPKRRYDRTESDEVEIGEADVPHSDLDAGRNFEQETNPAERLQSDLYRDTVIKSKQHHVDHNGYNSEMTTRMTWNPQPVRAEPRRDSRRSSILRSNEDRGRSARRGRTAHRVDHSSVKVKSSDFDSRSRSRSRSRSDSRPRSANRVWNYGTVKKSTDELFSGGMSVSRSSEKRVRSRSAEPIARSGNMMGTPSNTPGEKFRPQSATSTRGAIERSRAQDRPHSSAGMTATSYGPASESRKSEKRINDDTELRRGDRRERSRSRGRRRKPSVFSDDVVDLLQRDVEDDILNSKSKSHRRSIPKSTYEDHTVHEAYVGAMGTSVPAEEPIRGKAKVLNTFNGQPKHTVGTRSEVDSIILDSSNERHSGKSSAADPRGQKLRKSTRGSNGRSYGRKDDEIEIGGILAVKRVISEVERLQTLLRQINGDIEESVASVVRESIHTPYELGRALEGADIAKNTRTQREKIQHDYLNDVASAVERQRNWNDFVEYGNHPSIDNTSHRVESPVAVGNSDDEERPETRSVHSNSDSCQSPNTYYRDEQHSSVNDKVDHYDYEYSTEMSPRSEREGQAAADSRMRDYRTGEVVSDEDARTDFDQYPATSFTETSNNRFIEQKSRREITSEPPLSQPRFHDERWNLRDTVKERTPAKDSTLRNVLRYSSDQKDDENLFTITNGLPDSLPPFSFPDRAKVHQGAEALPVELGILHDKRDVMERYGGDHAVHHIINNNASDHRSQDVISGLRYPKASDNIQLDTGYRPSLRNVGERAGVLDEDPIQVEARDDYESGDGDSGGWERSSSDSRVSDDGYSIIDIVARQMEARQMEAVREIDRAERREKASVLATESIVKLNKEKMENEKSREELSVNDASSTEDEKTFWDNLLEKSLAIRTTVNDDNPDASPTLFKEKPKGATRSKVSSNDIKNEDCQEADEYDLKWSSGIDAADVKRSAMRVQYDASVDNKGAADRASQEGLIQVENSPREWERGSQRKDVNEKAEAEMKKDRLSPTELRLRMAEELQRQDEIYKYTLELADLEQAHTLQAAAGIVQQAVSQAEKEAWEARRIQELSLQRQAYELSLTSTVASSAIASRQVYLDQQASLIGIHTEAMQQQMLNEMRGYVNHIAQVEENLQNAAVVLSMEQQVVENEKQRQSSVMQPDQRQSPPKAFTSKTLSSSLAHPSRVVGESRAAADESDDEDGEDEYSTSFDQESRVFSSQLKASIREAPASQNDSVELGSMEDEDGGDAVGAVSDDEEDKIEDSTGVSSSIQRPRASAPSVTESVAEADESRYTEDFVDDESSVRPPLSGSSSPRGGAGGPARTRLHAIPERSKSASAVAISYDSLPVRLAASLDSSIEPRVKKSKIVLNYYCNVYLPNYYILRNYYFYGPVCR